MSPDPLLDGGPMATKVCDKAIVARSVRFEFANGEVLMCDLNDLTEEMRDRSALHGISARVGDSFAGAAKESDPVAWAYEQAKATWRAMQGGDWSVRRSEGSILAEALARVTVRTLEEAVAAIAKLDDEAKKKLAKAPSIKLAVAQIALERATKAAEASSDGDVEDLLSA